MWHVAARKNHLTVPGYHWPHVTGRRPELSRRAVNFVGKHEESDEDGPVMLVSDSLSIYPHLWFVVSPFEYRPSKHEDTLVPSCPSTTNFTLRIVACGHTIGSVCSADFPNLVRRNNSDSSGVGLAFFDSTRIRSSDSAMLGQSHFYPAEILIFIVVALLNIYVWQPKVHCLLPRMLPVRRTFGFGSAGNATMDKYVAFLQLFYFGDHLVWTPIRSRIRADMIAKMINTVPSDVTLTDEIVLLLVKASNAYINVVKDRLILSTFLRVTIHSNFPMLLIKFRFPIAVSSQRPSRSYEPDG